MIPGLRLAKDPWVSERPNLSLQISSFYLKRQMWYNHRESNPQYQEEVLMSTPSVSLLSRIRQNHALEHATIHILSRRHPHPKIVARSDWNGFTVYGNLDTVMVASAASEALVRLQAGEKNLAVHPRCGTNLVVGGLVAGAASSLTLIGKERSPLKRFGNFVAAATVGILLAQPLGPIVQQYVTTSSDLRGVYIREIVREQRGKLIVHRVRVGLR